MEKIDHKSLLMPFEAQKDFVNARVHDGIEQNRKKNVTFLICDKDGKPVNGAKLRLKQKNHEFLHGANIFMLDELESAEKNETYKKKFAEVFNLATLPFYWNALEPEDGKPRFAKDSPKVYRRPAPDLCLEYCEKNGIVPKLHCLNYDLFRPDWLAEKYPTTLDQKKRLAKRFEEIAKRYADKIHGIEVINETLYWPPLTAFGERNKRYEGFLAEPDIVEWSFNTAERYFPDNELIINEGTSCCFEDFRYDRSAYYMQIERALLKGARIDSIGMQFHFWWRGSETALENAKIFYDPYRIYEVLDTYAKLGKPIQITEITIPSGPSREELDIQAELLRNLYSVWFSHGSVEAAIYWNLVDGYAWGAKQGDMTAGENQLYGGLLNFDMSEKPAFKVLKELFTKEWRTDATLETGSLGTANVKAFCGEYDAEIVIDGKTTAKHFSISKKDTEHILRIIV